MSKLLEEEQKEGMQRGRELCLRGSAQAVLQREPRGLLLLTRGGREAQFSLKSLRNI